MFVSNNPRREDAIIIYLLVILKEPTHRGKQYCHSTHVTCTWSMRTKSSVIQLNFSNFGFDLCLKNEVDLIGQLSVCEKLLSTIPIFIFTARKRSLRRLCFYRCLSIHRFRGGLFPRGVSLPGPPWQGDSSDKETPQQGAHLARGFPWQGAPWQGDPLEERSPRRRSPWRRPPWGLPQSMLGDTVNTWVVRILLECNLVRHII